MHTYMLKIEPDYKENIVQVSSLKSMKDGPDYKENIVQVSSLKSMIDGPDYKENIVQVSSLKSMIDGPDYKEKLGTIVSHLYKLAFKTYADIPRGPVKVNFSFLSLQLMHNAYEVQPWMNQDGFKARQKPAIPSKD